MTSYENLSRFYDRFTQDVDYEQWADFAEAVFKRECVTPRLVLDLACGTGTLTRIMAQRGYEMIGVDASVEMLMQAQSNTMDCDVQPIYLNQRMEGLDLYGTIDVCLCCLDSINYVTDPNALQTAFNRVHLFLEPKTGIFIFDINTPKKFADIDGNSYVREDDGVFCVWQAAVQEKLCAYQFDIFEAQGRDWQRFQEFHEERIYALSEIQEMLTRAGFSEIACYGDLSFGAIDETKNRVYFTARKA